MAMAMAVATGNAGAVAAAKAGLAPTKSSTPSWDSFVRVSARGAPSPSVSRLALRSAGRRRQLDSAIGVASRKGAAKEFYTKNEAQQTSNIGGSALPQFLDLEREPATVHSDAVEEYEQLLEEKAREVRQLNQGTTIFLVGMMASGKSTVGRIVAAALGYEFFDSDEVIESYVGGLPVKDIFRQQKEAGFRELETRALRELAAAKCLVVATGGGAVVRRQNWAYLQSGITVWLDVPVEDLAKRVTAVGTESRPLLGGDCGAFDQAFLRLSKLMYERAPHYAMADCRLSFQDLASNLRLQEVADLTPTAIAVQVLEEIRQLLQWRKYMHAPFGF